MKIAMIVGLTVVLSGCESGLYNVISENLVIPSVSTPSAGAFSSLSGVPITWSADKNADQYVIYRRVLTSPTQTIIYQGAGQSILDTTAAADTMYLYSLAKIRGSKQLGQGDLSIGAWDQHYVADPNGLNDTKDTAKPFGTNTVSDSIFYFTGIDSVSGQPKTIDDNDWYYIDLGPKLQVFLIFAYSDSAQSGQLIVTTTTDVIATNNEEISVFNSDVVTQRIWFNVHYNTGVASSNTQTRVDYQLQYKDTTNYVPAS